MNTSELGMFMEVSARLGVGHRRMSFDADGGEYNWHVAIAKGDIKKGTINILAKLGFEMTTTESGGVEYS